MKLVSYLQIAVIGIISLTTGSLLAQTLSSGLHQQAADSTGFAAITATSPPDDSVLSVAPAQISLAFPQRVRLVKLTLRNQVRDWVDISFRYNPQLSQEYAWALPELENAIYYTADWAILGSNEVLVRGSFSFSFGPEAEPPSVTKEAATLLLELRNGGPNLRYVTPPRTEIIINRDPPQYDPPFTIELEEDQSSKPE